MRFTLDIVRSSVVQLVMGSFLILGVGFVGCADPDKISKDVEQRVRRDLDQRVRTEVDRQLRAALPRMEAKLRAQLTGKTLVPAARVRPRPTPTDPAVDPKLGPGPSTTADAGVAVAPQPDPKGLKLKRHLIVKQVKDRKAMGEGTSFAVADGQVYCFLDAVNPKGPERHLSVAWIHDGKPFHTVKLRVGVGHVWRTWARLRLRKQSVGKWQCAVSNEEGQLISRAEFTVQ